MKIKVGLRVLASLLAVALGVAVLAASGSENTAKKVDSSSGGSAVSGSSDGGAAETFKVGDTVELGDWQIKVHSFTDPVEIPADSLFKPEEGQRRVKFDAEVFNKSEDPANVSSLLCFELKDGENRAYTQTIGSDSAVKSIDGEVAPGASLRGEMSYDVPNTSNGFVLNFKCDLFSSGSASIKLS